MKKILAILFAIILCVGALCFAVSAEDNAPARVVDEADLLSTEEEGTLKSRLDELSEKYEMDIVVLAVESVGDKTPEEYADDYYDYNGYGYGSNYDGLLLLVSMEERDWYISTCGEAINAFTDSNIETIGSLIADDLGDENYYSAFSTFADQCEYYIDGHINGFPFDFGMNLVISIVVGLIVAAIATSVMKGKLKSVRFQNQAANYVKAGSMNVTLSRDFFLYRTVTRTAKPKESSSTHTSSSGRTHGGGGGKF